MVLSRNMTPSIVTTTTRIIIMMTMTMMMMMFTTSMAANTETTHTNNNNNSNITDSTSHGTETQHEPEPALAVLFPWFSEIMGIVIFYLLARFWKSLPYTAALFILGVAMGIGSHKLGRTDQLTESILMWSEIDSEVLLLVFLPGLIFRDAFSLNVHLFLEAISQISIFAFPMVLAGTTLTALVAYYVKRMFVDGSNLGANSNCELDSAKGDGKNALVFFSSFLPLPQCSGSSLKAIPSVGQPSCEDMFRHSPLIDVGVVYVVSDASSSLDRVPARQASYSAS